MCLSRVLKDLDSRRSFLNAHFSVTSSVSLFSANVRWHCVIKCQARYKARMEERARRPSTQEHPWDVLCREHPSASLGNRVYLVMRMLFQVF